MKRAMILAILLGILASCYDQAGYGHARAATWGRLGATVTVHIAWPWDAEITYAKGDAVTMPEFTEGGPIYTSRRDGNKGVMPPSMIGTGGSAYGEEGDELPWIVPTPGWEAWWKLVGTGE